MKVRTEVGLGGGIGEVEVWMVVAVGMLSRHLDEISMRRALSGGVLEEVAAFLHLWLMGGGGR